jgi:hypothetical protein
MRSAESVKRHGGRLKDKEGLSHGIQENKTHKIQRAQIQQVQIETFREGQGAKEKENPAETKVATECQAWPGKRRRIDGL